MRKIYIFFLLLPFSIWSACDKSNDPSRVVIAGGSITEIVYFLEYEDKLVGIDVTSNFPEETSEIPSIGYVRALSTEGILSLKPSLILGEEDMGPPLVINQLKLTGMVLKIINEDRSAQGILEKIECVSKILGITTQERLNKIKNLTRDINLLQSIAKKNEDKDIRIMLILNMQGTSPIVAGQNTSGDGFIKMVGGKNVASNFEGWKPISSESIIAYDPHFIIITERGMSSFSDIESLSNTTALKFTNAAQLGKIYSEDGMAMLGFGVRTIKTALNFAEIFSK